MLSNKFDPAASPPTDIDMAVLLGQHYGDGMVYLSGGNDRVLLERAMEMGLVSDDGYLTPVGYQFWLSRQS